MNCFNCQKQFDQKLRTPRLLIFCGHSLCEACCQKNFSNNKIACPECNVNTFAQKIQFLPKNLALINSNTTHGQSKINIKQCLKHNKKYQAFCSKQKELICIDCILQDNHKHHEMDSIKNSYKKEIQFFNAKVQKTQKFILSIKQKAHKNKQNQELSKNNYFTIKDQINLLFKQIKNIIQEQENSIIRSISQSFQLNQTAFQYKNEQFQSKLAQISSIMQYFQKDLIKSDLQFLQMSSCRDQKFNGLKFEIQQTNKINTFNYSKNTTLEDLMKCLNSIKQNKHNSNKPNNNISNIITLNQKKIKTPLANDANNNIKAVRKNQMTNNINLNPPQKIVKKISMKKQLIPSFNQNSGMFGGNQFERPKSSNLIALNQNCQKQKLGRQNEKKQKEKIAKGLKNINKVQVLESDLSTVYCRQSQSLCNSFMSNMTCFLSQKKVSSIYLIGGFNQQSNNIVKLNLNTMIWENVAMLQTNISKFGAVAISKDIYIFGGKKGKERLCDSKIFNVQTNIIKKCSTMSNNRSGFGVVLVSDLIYIIGGNDGQNILNTVQTFNIRTNQWKKKQSMKDKRDQLAVIAGDNKIYAIGGFGGQDNQPLKSVQILNLQTNKWQYLPDMNYCRRALSAAFLADGVYAIGGFDGTSYMKSVQKYQYGQDKWVQICPMNVARCTHSSISLFQSQQIYVFGGFDYFPLDTVQRYSLITNKWENVCKMPSSRFMHSSIVIKQE